MNKFRRVIPLLLLACLLASATPVCAAGDPATACKSFFVAVNHKNYATAWGLLTEKSKQVFCSKVSEAGAGVSTAEIRHLFDTGSGPMVSGFWTSFRDAVRADVYSSCTYVGGKPTGRLCIVKATRADKGVTVTMKAYQEGGTWHLGYAETFIH